MRVQRLNSVTLRYSYAFYECLYSSAMFATQTHVYFINIETKIALKQKYSLLLNL